MFSPDGALISASAAPHCGGFIRTRAVHIETCLQVSKRGSSGPIYLRHSQSFRMGSPSRGGGVTVYVCDKNQPSLPTPFYYVLVSISAFMALSPVFHSINSPDDSPLSQSVLLVK